jgi:5-methylcytosine-specific restriction endonuclease McrA
MGKRKLTTPRTQIRAALRRLWLRSRERAAALRRTEYKCERCGIKQSRAKGKEVYVEVHHKDGVAWSDLVDLVFERLLPSDPEKLEVLCKECHKQEHDRGDE